LLLFELLIILQWLRTVSYHWWFPSFFTRENWYQSSISSLKGGVLLFSSDNVDLTAVAVAEAKGEWPYLFKFNGTEKAYGMAIGTELDQDKKKEGTSSIQSRI
jgi:hypothetical protein